MSARDAPDGRGRSGTAASQPRRAPVTCPVCGDRLVVNGLGCDECGTELSGHFAPCDFCALAEDDRQLLRVFLTARGNMKELERHLAVSYPTARARFDAVLGRLGIVPPSPPSGGAATGGTDPGRSGPTVATAARSGRVALLQDLAAGNVDVDEALDRL